MINFCEKCEKKIEKHISKIDDKSIDKAKALSKIQLMLFYQLGLEILEITRKIDMPVSDGLHNILRLSSRAYKNNSCSVKTEHSSVFNDDDFSKLVILIASSYDEADVTLSADLNDLRNKAVSYGINLEKEAGHEQK